MVGVLKEALKFVVVVVAAVAVVVVVVVAALQSVPLTFPVDIKKKIFNRKIYLDKKLSKKFFLKSSLKYCIYLVRRIIVGHLISNRSNRWLWSILLRGTSLCFLLHILT